MKKMDSGTPTPKGGLFHREKKENNFIVSVLVTAVRLLGLLILLGGLVVGGIVFGIVKGYTETAPTLDLTKLDEQDKTSFFYDRNGNLITDYKGTENRVMINISMMPEDLRNAFVAVEDARFYTHNGIDVKRILSSFISNFLSGGQQGGSTITQQLIKNTILSSEQSYKRKIQEAYLAMQLEKRYTKSEILEYYLNTIYLGENYYGVQVAAQGYFGKDPLDLTLRECAMLAGLTSNPYYYNPRRNFYTRTSETTDYVAITNDRTDYVLRCMYENEFITEAQYQAALDPSTAQVLESDPSSSQSMYPYAHYVEYAVQEIIDCFLELNGLEDTSENRAKMESELRTGGYHITLAIDTEIQEILEDTIDNYSYPALRDPNDKVYRTLNSDGTYTEVAQPQAAAVVLDYRTGEIMAMVGSRGRPTVKKSLNRATDMKMPVGSAIKPIAVYAPALEMGCSPASVVYNIPVPISGYTGSDGKDSWPKNYGGGDYTGPETLREAMRRSHNVSAAQTLLNYVGIDRSVSYLKQMGVSEDNIDATPYGLSLGSSGITPLQLAVAYGVLGNGGTYQEPISFLGISDSAGNVVWDSHAQQERVQVFRKATAYMTVDMMKTVVSSGTATGAKIKGQTVAGKTGTNSDERGVTFCGMTGWYVASVWIGHDNYKPLSSKVTAGTSAVPLWNSFMTKIHTAKGLANRDIIEEDPSDLGLVKVTTCAVSGQLATEACQNDCMGCGTVTDYWYASTVPTVYCQMHQAVTLCADSGMIATEYCPNTVLGGVTVIPSGHPLSIYAFDQEYSGVVSSYLGTSSAIGTCVLHTSEGTSSGIDSTLTQDARQLLEAAYSRMNELGSSNANYQAIYQAASSLESILSGFSSSSTEVAAGMAALTQALAASYY